METTPVAGPTTHFDVVIVGAGLSGIGAGHYLQTECPWADYAIFEARDAIGGTWDLFRYPGIRSDSDMHTLGYSFRPWDGEKSIADGDSILQYIKDTASGVRRRHPHPLPAPDHRPPTGRRPIRSGTSRRSGRTRTRPSSSPRRFLFSCSGYYRYDHGYLPDFAGMDDFEGTIVHPQAWPEGLDFAGKRIVVIGSGATAVTLVPALAQIGGPRDHAAALAHVHRLAAREEPRRRTAAQGPAAETGRCGHEVVPRPGDAGLLPGEPEVPEAGPAHAGQGPASASCLPATTSPRTSRPATTHGTSASAPCPNGDLFRVISAGTASVVTDRSIASRRTGSSSPRAPSSRRTSS